MAQKTTKALRSREIALEALERWARYCAIREDGGTGWAKRTLLGRMLDGMPGTTCPKCLGKGHVHIQPDTGPKVKLECPTCDGQGRVKLDTRETLVNPALIMPTGSKARYDDDPVAQRVDWIICAHMTEDSRIILRLQYLRNGTQEQKARRLRISQGHYSKILGEAVEELRGMIELLET